MLLKHHKENNVCRSPIFILANIFGVIPFYDFNKKRLTHIKLFKLYGGLITFLITVIATACYLYGEQDRVSMSWHMKLLQFLVILNSLILFLVTVLGSSFQNMQSWEHLLNLLCHTEFYSRQVRCNFPNLSSILIIMGTIHGLALFLIILYLVGTIYAVIYFHVIILQYARMLIVCLMHDIIKLLRNKYQAIDSKLTHVHFCTVIKNSTLDKLREMRTLYMECNKIVELFNQILGWPLLFTLAGSVEIVLTTLSVITEGGITHPENNAKYNEIMIMKMFYTVMALVSINWSECCFP